MTLSDAREANRAQDGQLFHNVYINPEAYAHFAATKEFPDPTILVMEVFVPGIAIQEACSRAASTTGSGSASKSP